MKTGLQYIAGKTYFFNDDGYMQTGKVANVEEIDERSMAIPSATTSTPRTPARVRVIPVRRTDICTSTVRDWKLTTTTESTMYTATTM